MFLTFYSNNVYLSWVKSFKPYVEFRLTESRISLKNKNDDEIQVEITPGSSFGSEHPTTRLCIRAIEDVFMTEQVKSAVDLGCGSGVLGMCALALGAERLLAVDIDPLAVKEAIANLKKNNFNSRSRVQHGSIDDIHEKFDLVMANIVTDELLAMVEGIKSLLKTHSTLLVSGIYEIKKDKAIDGFNNAGFSLTNEYIDSGWVAMRFKLG